MAIALAGALWVGHPALALLVGATVSLALSPELPSYVSRAGHLCLKAAIVSLGFTLNVQVLWQTSRDHSGLIVIFVICTLIAGLVIGRLMKVDEDQSRLLSTGTAICGGTAIVTLAPIIRARPESVAICIGIVFILNAIAILLLPWVGHYLEMTQDQFGVWVALAIHDTSSVVGAAAIFGDRALEVATTVKLVRTLLLIPIALMAGVLLRQRANTRTGSHRNDRLTPCCDRHTSNRRFARPFRLQRPPPHPQRAQRTPLKTSPERPVNQPYFATIPFRAVIRPIRGRSPRRSGRVC